MSEDLAWQAGFQGCTRSWGHCWLAGGPIIGGLAAAGIGALSGRDIKVTAVLVPVCEKCVESLTPEQKKQLEKKPGDFFVSSVKNGILCCEVKGNMVHLTLEKDYIATALIALNKDVVREESEAIGDAPGKVDKRSVQAIPTPAFDDETRHKYTRMYQRDFMALDLAIIDAWHRLLSKESSIYTYPGIPERKLSNAKTSYAVVAPRDILLGLQDSTVFGSAKQGMLFNTRFIYWSGIGLGPTGYISFAELHPSKSQYKYGWLEKCILLGDKRIASSGISEEAVKALVAFIMEATLLLRGSEQPAAADGLNPPAGA